MRSRAGSCRILPERRQIDPRRIGKEHQHKCKLPYKEEELIVNPLVDERNGDRADEYSREDKNHRCCDIELLQATRDKSKGKDGGGKYGNFEFIHDDFPRVRWPVLVLALG